MPKPILGMAIKTGKELKALVRASLPVIQGNLYGSRKTSLTGAFCMTKQIKFTKKLFVKLIAGGFSLVFFLNLLYVFGLLITAEYLGDYNEAQYAVYGYGLIRKIFLALSTGFFVGGIFVFSAVAYRIGLMLFNKGKDVTTI